MFWESVAIAFEGLRANKMRSLLTMLGIIIGVGAVIAMVSIGLGVRDKVQKSIASLGSNLLIIMPGSTAPSGVRVAAGGTTTLTYDDAQAIAREVGGVSFVAPQVQRQYQAVFGGNNWITSMQGITPDFMTVRNFELSDGSFITLQQLEARERVAVLGKTVVDNLFGGISPVGQTIRINKSTFRVIGVLTTKGQSAGGQDQDDMILVPLKTAQERMMGINYVQSISVQADSAEAIDQVLVDITSLLKTRHRIQAGEADDFSVRNLTALMATATETTDTITLLLGNTAAISLLVGGIGIMNIMLVSVTERTREIGVRKALGATFANILLQFLIEAIVIGVTGGLIGILLGLGASYLISNIFGWATVISGFTIALAFGFSVLIGVIFGLYPARKAAKLDPIDALRYE
jgi:putative ABC transport system permease protein